MRVIVASLLLAVQIFAAEWLTNYDRALERSRSENKPILVVMMRQSCPYCQMLIHDTLPQAAIDKKIVSEFVPLMLDTEENPREVSRSRLQANAVPASFILNQNGAIKSSRMGYASPMEYMRFLQSK